MTPTAHDEEMAGPPWSAPRHVPPARTSCVVRPEASARAVSQGGLSLRPPPPPGPSRHSRVGSRIGQGRASHAAINDEGPQILAAGESKGRFLAHTACLSHTGKGWTAALSNTAEDGRRPVRTGVHPRDSCPASCPQASVGAGAAEGSTGQPAIPQLIVSDQGPPSSTEKGAGLGGRGASPPPTLQTHRPGRSMTQAQREEPAVWPWLSDTQGKGPPDLRSGRAGKDSAGKTSRGCRVTPDALVPCPGRLLQPSRGRAQAAGGGWTLEAGGQAPEGSGRRAVAPGVQASELCLRRCLRRAG